MKQLVAILAGILFWSASLSRAGDANKEDLDRLQGKWTIETFIVNGKAGKTGNIWHIMGNKVFYTPDSPLHSVIKLDASQKPRAFEFDTIATKPGQSEQGRKGIYEIDGDTIKFCVAMPGGKRPTTFESKEGSGSVLTVLKRAKTQDAASQEDLKKLQGKWKLVSILHEGKPSQTKDKIEFYFIFGNKITYGDKRADEIKLDATRTPKAMDVRVPRKGEPTTEHQAIYALDGDNLKICIDIAEKGRPTTFESNVGSGCRLITLRRVTE